MTRVTLFADDDGCPRGFSAEGHSGSALRGRDIVCAAVSVLATNTINAIGTFTEDRPRIEQDERDARMSCLFDERPGKESELLLRTFFLGVGDISKQYGKYVRVNREVVK